MIVCLSFHAGDLSLALANLSLVQSLGGCTDFDCLLVTDDQTPHAEMQRIASQTFRKVETLVLSNLPHGWPLACNNMFERAAKQAQQNYPNQPFLFLEADTTPIRPGWLKDIAAAYVANGQPFMGAIRNTFGTHNGMPEFQGGKRVIVGKHMNGVGVYPAGYFGASDILRIVPHSYIPFDVQLSDEQASRPFLMNGRLTTGRADSPLFAHSWKTRNFRLEGERFVCEQDDTRAEMDEINPRVTAIFHGAKDLSLVDLIRAQTALLPQGVSIGYGASMKFSKGETDEWKRDAASQLNEAKGESVYPEWLEFQAWKRQAMLKATVDLASGPSPSEILLQRSSTLEPITRLSDALPSFTDVQQAQTAAGMPQVALPVQAVIPTDPNNGRTPPIPVDSIPVGTEARLEPMNDPAQRLATIPTGDFPTAAVPALENSRFAVDLNIAALPHPETPFQPVPASTLPSLAVEPSLTVKEENQAPVELVSEIPSNESSELSAEDKTKAIKADIRSGMAHKLLMVTHSVNAVTLKGLKAEVATEDLQPA